MKTIIAATDFSRASRNAVNYAAQLALATGSKLLVLHTTQFSIVGDSLLDVSSAIKRTEDEGQKELTDLGKILREKYPGLKLEKKMQEGFTLEVLRAMVARGDVSMVVMGIYNTDNLYEAIFGSTSVTVAGSLICPVLIVPENARFRELKKIAFAFDQKNIPTDTGLHLLAELKAKYNSTVNYVNVLDGVIPLKDDSSLQSVFNILKDETRKIHYLQQGKRQVADIITDYVRRHKPNMLVMISRKHSLIWRIFNKRNTKQIAFNTTVPLLAGSGTKKMYMKENTLLIKDIRKKGVNGTVDISPETIVHDLEEKFREEFGLNVQVFRKSGKIWLETTATDNWTLGYQNSQGQELDKANLSNDREETDYHEQK